jgi:dTDP-4-amino-4,6-dideoxygalactose transaminase
LTAAKQRNIVVLRQALCTRPGVSAPPVAVGCTMGGWYDAVVSVDPVQAGFDRDDLIRALVAEGVKARIPTTGPLQLTSVFSGAVPLPGTRSGTFRSAADLHRSIALHSRWVSLPATYFNDPAGRLVPSYLAAFERTWQRLDSRNAR